jgi:hypothetical protein
LRAEYVSGQYGVILPANFLKEKEEMKLKVYNNSGYLMLTFSRFYSDFMNIY